MKKLYLLFLTLISFSGIAQTTKVFPDSIAYWSEYSVGGDGSGGTVDYQDYLMLGDTIVDGKSYKNLFLHRFVKYDYKSTNGYVPPLGYNMINDRFGLSTKIGLVRRDSLKLYFRYHKNKYWWMRNDSMADKGAEFLVADFGWQPGDTIFNPNYKPGTPGYLVVKEKKRRFDASTSDTIEYLTFYGTERGNLASKYSDSNIVITGMGFNSSFFFMLRNFDTSYISNRLHGGYSGVTFFCADKKPFYGGNQNCDSVDMKISIGINEINKTSLTTYPNPAKDYITLTGFEGEDVMSINISDIVGHKQELKYESDGEQALVDISALPQGLYFITVYTDKTTYLCKIIKQL